MAQYPNNQGDSHTWHPPVDDGTSETYLGPVTSWSGMPDFPTEVTWSDSSTAGEGYTDNNTAQTDPNSVTSFSGMPDFPTEVTWPEMTPGADTTALYTGQPDSRGRYPRWRPPINTPNAYSASFNPDTEKRNCFFDTAGSIVGLSSVRFCEFIGYKRDQDVGVTATKQKEIIDLYNSFPVKPLRRYSLSATELALVNHDWGVLLPELQKVAENHFIPWSGDDNNTLCIGVRIGYYKNGQPGGGHWNTMRKLAQEEYIEDTDETNPFAVRKVTTFTWHVQDHQEDGREDWLTNVLAPNRKPHIKVTAVLGFARIDDKDKNKKHK